MISIHDIKGVLVTIGIVLVFSYGGFYIIHRIFRREFLRIYRYSLSLITGGVILYISLIGLVLSSYYAKRYSIWLFVIGCVGFTLLFYSESVLAQCEHKKEEYRKLLCSTKKLAIYDAIMFIVLIIKYCLIN